MKFIHVTDLHLTAPGRQLWGLDPHARLKACLEDIGRHHGDARFCAITGDLAESGEPAAYRALREALEEMPMPCHLMMGNHDERSAFRAVFDRHPVDANGFVQDARHEEEGAFLFLDTLKGPPSSAGVYHDDRKAWLSAQLDRAEGRPVYLFMHHPPFAIAHPLMDLIRLEEPDAFHALLAGHDIRHIFFGHAHRTISGHWRGISYSALPALNHQLPLVGGSVPTVYSREPAMYSVVHLEDDRLIVHSDAFLDRRPAEMAEDAERGNWH